MGDRANIVIKSRDFGQVCLYTHWQGSRIPIMLQQALIRGVSRWHDASYLTRIIFCEMVKNDINGTTGYGISQKIGDGNDRVLVVDVDRATVHIKGLTAWSFREYIEFIDMFAQGHSGVVSFALLKNSVMELPA